MMETAHRMTTPTTILTVCPSDLAGGAERVAWFLFKGYQARGCQSLLAVGAKKSADPAVYEIGSPPERAAWQTLARRLHARVKPYAARGHKMKRAAFWLDALAQGRRVVESKWGWETFYYPASRELLTRAPARPDIAHLHNLHGNYFDLRYLPKLSHTLPTVLTLHDGWLLSGHCSHSFDCMRWQTGCGNCPDLTIAPAIPRDETAHNWKTKQRIYAASRLYVATPSRGLMNKVEQSMLRAGMRQARVIPYGIDLAQFRPGDKVAARRALGLETDAVFLLASANWIRRNPWKDYKTMRRAVELAAAQWRGRPLVFLLLGEKGESEFFGNGEIRLMGFEQDATRITRYYQAADIFLHAAHSDTFPNTILEAMACGTPVVATAVGGIPEQVRDGVTGYLVPHANAEMMAQRIQELLTDTDRADAFGRAAAAVAQREYNLERQLDDYLNWYAEILAREKAQRQ
jgi:glycosyltransferase involved in cell wall biosynthesis